MLNKMTILLAIFWLLPIVTQSYADPRVPVIEPPLKAVPVRSGPPVGYVMMGPEASMRIGLNNSPATAELSNVFMFRMKSVGDNLNEQLADFSLATGWLKDLYNSGRTSVPILDTSFVWTSGGWREKILAKTGENGVNAFGTTTAWASFYSTTSRKMIFNYIDQLIDWVKINDKEHRITGYIDGAEWFMPDMSFDYNLLTIKAFRCWLKDKYGDIKTVNANWGSLFKSLDDVQPARPTVMGDWWVGRGSVGFSGNVQHFWVSPAVEVQQGCEYRISAQTFLENVPEGLGLLQFAWFDTNDKLMLYQAEHFALAQPNGKWLESSAVMKTPRNAVKLRFAIKLFSAGTIQFKIPACKNGPVGENCCRQAVYL